MHKCLLLIVFCSYAILCHAQTPRTDQALLLEAREKYDAPFNRNLDSFDCAIKFSWKQHFTETTRVGDEGTDEELETIFQPIRNRVTVTAHSVVTSSGLADDAISKLPHGGMAELLLEHAVQKSLYTWLPAGSNSILPDSHLPVSFQQSPTGYTLAFKVQNSDVEMLLTPDLRLKSATLKAPPTKLFDTSFGASPQGFLLTSWTMGEDGNSDPGHRLIFTYTYQTVDGVQLPEHVSIVRETHHEVWRYTLTNCTIKTTK